jgi:hypothetical protein
MITMTSVSFVHIEHLAVTHGQTELAAYLLPVSIDGTVQARSSCSGRPGSAWTRQHSPAPCSGCRSSPLWPPTSPTARTTGLTGSMLSSWPAVAFIGSAEMAIGMVRRTARQRSL